MKLLEESNYRIEFKCGYNITGNNLCKLIKMIIKNMFNDGVIYG